MSLRREEFGEVCGLVEFDLQPSNGARQRVAVRIGKPYSLSPREWACPVEIRGLEPRYPDIRGVDSLQALCLAISLVRTRLEDFIRDGGKILDVEDGSEWGVRELGATFGRTGYDRKDGE
jgi:hypothetical protein